MIALPLLLAVAACQDHHWSDTDKMGEVKMADRPAQAGPPKTTAGHATRPYDGAGALSGQAPAPAMGRAAQAPDGFVGLIAAGSVEVAAAAAGKADRSWTLFIIVRPVGGGAPLAALKAVDVTFPFAFRITEENLMMGGVEPGMKISLDARLDSDGDPMSRDAGKDLFGAAAGELAIGVEGVTITLGAAG
jgi:hypothetical protein